jgi:hypothetical protein
MFTGLLFVSSTPVTCEENFVVLNQASKNIGKYLEEEEETIGNGSLLCMCGWINDSSGRAGDI